MKNYYSNSEFCDFVHKCINIIKSAYQVDKVIVFEHGANKFGSMTACGTNHCHIHIVPMMDSLLDNIMEFVPFKKVLFEDVNEFVGDSEYLLYADVYEQIFESDCYVHILEKPISQFFRRIIATKLDCPDKYDYRENANISISNATFKTLQKEVENGN